MPFYDIYFRVVRKTPRIVFVGFMGGADVVHSGRTSYHPLLVHRVIGFIFLRLVTRASTAGERPTDSRA